MFRKFPGVKYMAASLICLIPSLFLFGNPNPIAQGGLIVSALIALILGMKGAKISREALREQQDWDTKE